MKKKVVVCENGHIQTDDLDRYRHLVPKRCKKCGMTVLFCCSNCQNPFEIIWKERVPATGLAQLSKFRVDLGTQEAPPEIERMPPLKTALKDVGNFCQKCKNPFPWYSPEKIIEKALERGSKALEAGSIPLYLLSGAAFLTLSGAVFLQGVVYVQMVFWGLGLGLTVLGIVFGTIHLAPFLWRWCKR